jgi:hypothetical protein
MAALEEALAEIWDTIGNEPPRILISMEAARIWKRKIRIWRTIRIHPRWANPKRRQHPL